MSEEKPSASRSSSVAALSQPSVFIVERESVAITPFGMYAPYVVKYEVRVENQEEYNHSFRNGAPLDTDFAKDLADLFHDEVIRPVMDKKALFFLYFFDAYDQPNVRLWEYHHSGPPDPESTAPHLFFSATPTAFDEHNALAPYLKLSSMADVRAWIREEAGAFVRHGCSVSYHALKSLPNEAEFLEENLKMASPEVLKAIRENSEYARIMEVMCVSFLDEQLKLFSSVKHYGAGDTATLEVVWAGEHVKIAWRNTLAQDGWRLLGFRGLGGFSDAYFDETKNGIRFVDSHDVTGAVLDMNVPVGEPVYYTFFLKRWEKPLLGDGEYHYYRVARFSESRPEQSSVETLQRQLAEARLRADIAAAQRKGESSYQQRLSAAQQDMGMVKQAMWMLSDLDRLQEELLRQVDSQSPEAQRRRDDIIDVCNRVRDSARGLVN